MPIAEAQLTQESASSTKNRRLHILYAVFRNAPPRSLLHCNVGLATYKVPRNLSEFRFLKAKCHARKRSA